MQYAYIAINVLYVIKIIKFMNYDIGQTKKQLLFFVNLVRKTCY